MMPPIANRVTIGDKTYKVEQVVQSGSRGAEYLLSLPGQRNCRVCHAPPRKVSACRTGGETIVYHWR